MTAPLEFVHEIGPDKARCACDKAIHLERAILLMARVHFPSLLGLRMRRIVGKGGYDSKKIRCKMRRIPPLGDKTLMDFRPRPREWIGLVNSHLKLPRVSPSGPVLSLRRTPS